MKAEIAQKLAKEMLSPKRFTHEGNVAKAAEELTAQYGGDAEQARLAAWLHDIVKEKSPEELRRMMQLVPGKEEEIARRPLPVWHGPCAAIYAKQTLGVTDEDVLSAVACHTTGKPGMSHLDKILLLADMISAERDYEGVEELRRLAKQDLDKAVVSAIRRGIQHVQQKGNPLDEMAVQALNSLVPKA